MKQKADVYENPLWTAYYDGTNGSPTELHYYANINDDIRLPTIHGIMQFDLELWRVDRYWGIIKKWDKKLVSGIDCYTISEPGHSETLKVEKKDEFEQVKYEAKVRVETIGIEKANTIAIYETNGTVFNGHYQEQERMNIIQLYVNDSGTGTPFEEGLNSIVIPTSLFTETIFNAHVQNETLNETTIYRDDEELFKFISVGRDGETEQACEEIDFIIIRFDISSEDAMEVLNLLLECLVNETTNETAIVYNYVSTKENDTVAVMMNLPFSILGLIPWYCNFSNSPMGSKPETFEDWFWKPLATIGMLIVGVIITIGMAFVELFMMMIDFFAAIFMDILPILGYILWLIICAIILIFIYIVFALTLITVVIVFLIMIGVFISFGGISNMEIDGNLNSIVLSNGNFNVRINYKTKLEFNHFLKTLIPIVIISFESVKTYEFSLSFFSTSTPNFIDSFYKNLFSTPEQSSIPHTSSIETNLNTDELLKGLSTIIGLFGSVMNIIGLLLLLPPSVTIKDIYKVIIIAFLLGTTLGIVIPSFLTANKDSLSYLIGLNMGITIVFGVISFLNVSPNTALSFTEGFGNIGISVSILMNLLTYFELSDKTNDNAFFFSLATILKTAWAIMALLTGAFLIQRVTNPNLKFAIQDTLLIVTWITGGFIGGYSKWWIDTHNN